MIRRLLSKRYVRILLWLFITAVTLIVLLRVWIDWSGRRRWAVVKATIENAGETLDFRQVLPPTPPEAENLLAIEPLKGITEAIDHDEAKGEPGAKRKALEAMKPDTGGPASRGVEKGEMADMQAWATYLKNAKFLDLPAQPSTAPGSEVLQALDAKFPLLKQLSDLAPQRSQAMFIPGLHERELPEMLFSISLRHYSGAQYLTRLLALRARAAIDAKQGAEALRSLLATAKIAYACEAEPMLIGFLVGVAAETTLNEALWLGLQERTFNEAELQKLQTLLGAHELDKVLLQAFRGELSCAVNSMQYMQDVAAGRKQMVQGAPILPLHDYRDHSIARLRILPGGLFHHWMSVIAEQEWQHALEPLRQGGIVAAFKTGGAINADLSTKNNSLLHPDYIMASMVLPAITSVSASALHAQARERQALTAIALERYYLKHAKYPAALQELVPEFIPAVPLDPCDGKALRYRLTAAGRYTLWCIGVDCKDDAGLVNKNGVAMKSALYLGDWTWQYEPVAVATK